MKWRFTTSLTSIMVLGFATLSVLTGLASAETQKPIRFYDGGWENIQINNAIAIYILTKGFEVEAEDVPSDVPKMQAQLVSGELDVNLEMYNNLMSEWVEKQSKLGTIVEMGAIYEKASQGFYVPSYMIKGDAKRNIEATAPDLHSVDDLNRYVNVFRAQDPDRTAKFLNCIPGWACREVNLIKMATYGLDRNFKSVEPATEAGLNALVHAEYDAGRPFVTYYWSPSGTLGMIDMTLLQEPPYSAECWAAIERVLAPFQPGKPSEIACAYETIPILKYSNSHLGQANPVAAEFLRKMFVGSATMSKLAGYMARERTTPAATALYFLKTQSADWQKWVPEAVYRRVVATMNEQ